jgi:hypothetical protein
MRKVTKYCLLALGPVVVVCLAVCIHLNPFLFWPPYWRLDRWDREAVRLLERYGYTYEITGAGIELTQPQAKIGVLWLTYRAEEILGLGPDLWYELCRWLPEGLAEDWRQCLSSVGVTCLRREDRLFIWGPDVAQCRRCLPRELEDQWVFILEERHPAALEGCVDRLGRAGIESRLGGSELCVRRKDRIDGLETLGVPLASDSYAPVWLEKLAAESKEDLKTRLNEREIDFLEYPGEEAPGGLYVRRLGMVGPGQRDILETVYHPEWARAADRPK